MKLTPHQIRAIAEIIQYALEHFKEPQQCVESKETIETGKAKWEQYVEKCINRNNDLPFSYEEFERDHMDIYEFLVGYYSK
jgi:hypothetical protein